MSPSRIPAIARQTVLAPLDAVGRAELVAQRLTDAIRLGFLADGEQLPSESDLATQLGVSTVTLREALAALRQRGLVVTRRGRGGGTFVRSGGPARKSIETRLSGLGVDEMRDLCDERTAIAGTAARLAAERASESDYVRLREHLALFESASDGPTQRRADRCFHLEVAAATRSTRLTRQEMALHAELGPFVWLALDEPGARERAIAEHRAILDAIEARDGEEAQRLAEAHVADEHARLAELRLRLMAPSPAPSERDGRRAAVEEALARIAGTIEVVFASLDELRAEAVAAHDTATRQGRSPRRDDLAGLRAVLHHHLDRHRKLLAGGGLICAPGVLEDAPRWLEWWWRGDDDGPLRLLIVSLDPDDPDYYDYEAAEWFYAPQRTGERSIVGPFVDYSATDLPIFTLTLPVIADGEFIGVAGADMRMEQLEAVAAPELARIGAGAVLVNHRGRVIASTSARHLPGTLLSPGDLRWLEETDGPWAERPDGASLARCDRLPWALVVLGR